MMKKTLFSPADLSETEARLRSMRESDTPLWGSMSASQMMRHVAQCFEVAVGDRTVAAVKGPPQWLMKWLGLRSGLTWAKNMKTTQELAVALQQEDGMPFVLQVDHAIESMKLLAEGKRVAASHAFFGPMTGADWARWGYLHTDHHLRQFGH